MGVGDSLVGAAGRGRGGGLVREDTLRTVGISLNDVQSVAVKKTSVGNTVGLVAVVAVAVGFVAMTIECNNKEGFEKLDCP